MEVQEVDKLIETVYAGHTAHFKHLQGTENTHHAVVFAGIKEGGQRALAEYTARLLLNTSDLRKVQTDYLVVDPQAGEEKKNTINLESARQIRTHLLSKPVVAPHRVVILHDADRLTVQAANALLKVVEEPGSKSIIIMTTSRFDMLPKTLQSRVHHFNVPLLSHDAANTLIEDKIESKETREQIVHLAAGRVDMMLQMLVSAPDEEGSYTWWKEHIEQWLHFLTGSIEERSAMIQKNFLTGNVQEKTHTLPQVLNTIQMIFHDLLLLQYGIDGARTVRIDQSALQLLLERYSKQDIKQRLSRVDELRDMCNANVNKKTILDYIITGL